MAHRRTGLSSSEAARRSVRDGPNRLPQTEARGFSRIVLSVLLEPMFLMLLAAGAVYLLLGDRGEAIALLVAVFGVIALTVTQERRTQRALEALRDMSAPRALVLRDGEERHVSSSDVVVGDLLLVHEGGRVAADARLLEGHVRTDESLLTGESVAVSKSPGRVGEDATGEESQPGGSRCLFASTVLTEGAGIAEVFAIGEHTAVGRIGMALAEAEEPPSGLQRVSRRLVRQLTVVGLTLATGRVLLGWLWDNQPLLESVLSGLALAMAILPEEIPVILTVFLALGAWRLSKRNVLVRRIPAVEALGATTVLAVDKTGTLTQNRMTVAELRADAEQFLVPVPTKGTASASLEESARCELPETFHLLLEYGMLATPVDPFDPMEKAIQRCGQRLLAGTEHQHAGWSPEWAYALSPDILAMTHVYGDEPADVPHSHPHSHVLATKGAPEVVMDLCHLSESERSAHAAEVEQMAVKGLRVLGVARGTWVGDGSKHESRPESQHDFHFTFLGLIGFVDPPRHDVASAIAECRAAGVRVIMMTGDHPATARAIAQQVGLSERGELLTGADLESLDDESLVERLQHTDLCARLRPSQKLRLVQLLQRGGDVVAMTGDGVNDAPALKAADVGVAMGERGTDVAREAAALVLLDDRFESMVAALRQGRRIYDNITLASRFVFAVHVPIIALALVPMLFHWPALILPVHIMLLELLIDPACSVLFEAEPEASDLMTRPPRDKAHSPFAWANLRLGVLQGSGVAATLIGGYALLAKLEWADAPARTAVFASLLMNLMLLVLFNRKRVNARAGSKPNRWLLGLVVTVGVVLALTLSIPPLRSVMGFSFAGGAPLAAAAAMSLVATLWLLVARPLATKR